MPRIPGLIEQDPNVRGAVPQQRADLETFAPGWRQVDTAIRTGGEIDQQVLGAEGRAAGSLAAIGEGIGDTAAYLQKRQVQDDVSNINQTAARARLEWTQHLNDKLANPPRDAAGNLQYQNIAQGTLDDFDAYSSKILDSGANTPEGQRYLAQQMAEMRTSLGEQAIVGQAHLAGVAHSENYSKTVDALTQSVRIDPTSSAAVIAQALKASEAEFGAGDLGKDGPGMKADAQRSATQSIVTSAYAGLIDKNPRDLSVQLSLPADQRSGFYTTLAQFGNGKIEKAAKDAADERVKLDASEQRAAKNQAYTDQQRNFAQNESKLTADLLSGKTYSNQDLSDMVRNGQLDGEAAKRAVSFREVQNSLSVQFKEDPATVMKTFRTMTDSKLSDVDKLQALNSAAGKGVWSSYGFLKGLIGEEDKLDAPYMKQFEMEMHRKLLDTVPGGMPSKLSLVDGYVAANQWVRQTYSDLKAAGMPPDKIAAVDGPIIPRIASFRSDQDTQDRARVQSIFNSLRSDIAPTKAAVAATAADAALERPDLNISDSPFAGLLTEPKPGLAPTVPNVPNDYPKKKPGEDVQSLVQRINEWKSKRK